MAARGLTGPISGLYIAMWEYLGKDFNIVSMAWLEKHK